MFRNLFRFLILILVFGLGLTQAQAFTITVEEKADGYDGEVCTLRNAVQTFNNFAAFGGCPYEDDGNPNTILLTEGDYILSIGISDNEPDNSQGDLNVAVPLSIVGPGPDLTRVSGSGFPANSTDRIFSVGEICANGGCEYDVVFQGFTIRDGQTNGLGGGVYMANPFGTLYLNQVRVTENRAADAGGGVFNFGFLVANDSSIDNNVSNYGGGVLTTSTARALFNHTLISQNQAVFTEVVEEIARVTGAGEGPGGRGGGILAEGPMMTINTTISGNVAGEIGGGVYIDSFYYPGGLEATGGEEVPYLQFLFNTTIANNQVLNSNFGAGGGIGLAGFDVIDEVAQPAITVSGDVDGQLAIPGEVYVTNTLIAQNQALNGPDCFGPYVSGGYNLLGDPSDCIGFDQTGDQTPVAEPGLDSLQDNGGPTMTHGLLASSPAIDMGNSVEGCQAPNIQTLIDSNGFVLEELVTDQRHFLRPIGVLDPVNPICDIGAFEFQVFDFDVTKSDDVNGESTVGSTFTYIITVTNSGPGVAANVFLSDPLPAEVTFNSVNTDQGTCLPSGNTVECDLGTLMVGQTVTVQVAVTTVAEGTFTNIVTVTSEGGDSQQLVTKEAQTTTTSTGQAGNLSVFGSGCQMSPLSMAPASGLISLLLALSALVAMRWGHRR